MVPCFIIEKRDGKIKARAVADGRTQQRYTEEETYSLTVWLDHRYKRGLPKGKGARRHGTNSEDDRRISTSYA